MLSILDDVKARIQKAQSNRKKREAELRRCNTDLRPRDAPRDKKPAEPMDEKQKLQKELNACSAARKSLEMMCSSLGKEKKIMALELARKVQELTEMEENINDIKAQNETLLAKVTACTAEHKEKQSVGREMATMQGSAALQELNKVLSHQVLKSLDEYRSLKRKFKDAQEENALLQATMGEMGVDVSATLDRIHSLQQRKSTVGKLVVDIDEDILALQHTFECFKLKISKHGQERTDHCVNPKAEINPRKPSVTVIA